MSPSDPPPKADRSSRRRFLKGAALGSVAATAAVLGYTWQIEPFWWQTIRRDLPIRDLPSALEGRTLVQLSDLHIGPRVDEAFLTEAVADVAQFRPDVVVLTGDLVHYLRPRDAEQASRVLARLPLGRLATIAILGNHDYGHGWRDDTAARDVARRLRDLGITVLRNDVTEVEGLQVIGLDDLWARRFAPERVMPRVDPSRASIVLCHNPDGADKPGWGDWEGWILAGHTHGGQCKPPFLPPPLLPVENRRYTRGAFDLGDGRHLYINAGLGFLRQVRFNVRPEVTVFTLTRA